MLVCVLSSFSMKSSSSHQKLLRLTALRDAVKKAMRNRSDRSSVVSSDSSVRNRSSSRSPIHERCCCPIRAQTAQLAQESPPRSAVFAQRAQEVLLPYSLHPHAHLVRTILTSLHQYLLYLLRLAPPLLSFAAPVTLLSPQCRSQEKRRMDIRRC